MIKLIIQKLYELNNIEAAAIIIMLALLIYATKNSIARFLSSMKIKIETFLRGNLFPHTPNLALYYDRGFFTLYWTILWLICRFTFIPPVYLLLVEFTDWTMGARFFSILLSMLIALIPSLMLTAVADLNEIISALHFRICSTYRIYLKIVLRIFVFHVYTTNNNIREFLRFIFLFCLFIVYLFTNSSIILSLWLTIIYLGIYCDYIIFKIMPRDKVIKNIKTPIDTLSPETFLYNFRFHYWGNKLPYFYEQDAYERGYYFEAMDPKEFFLQVEMYNKSLDDTEKYIEYVKDPRYLYVQVFMILRSSDIMNIKAQEQESIKKILKNLEKEVLKEHPDLKTVLKTFKEELFEKYPHWRKDFTENVELKNVRKKDNISNRGVRSYHATPKSFVMGLEDEGSVKKGFIFPAFKNPIDISDFEEKIEELKVKPEDGVTIKCESTREGISFINKYPHPNAEEYSKMMPGVDPSRFEDKFLKVSISLDSTKAVAEIPSDNDSLTTWGGFAQKATQIAPTEDLIKKLPSGGSKQILKGFSAKAAVSKAKNPATLAAIAVGTTAFVVSLETCYELVNKSDSLTNAMIEGGKKTVDEVIKKGPDIAEEMSRDFDGNDTLKDVYQTREQLEPEPKGFFSNIRSFFGI